MNMPDVAEELAVDPRDLIEQWELNGEGTVYVYTFSPRDKTYVKTKVSSTSGSRRLRISADDRKYNEEQIMPEMQQHNPFRNGMLRLISKERGEDVDETYHLTTDDLREMLEIRDEETFQEAIAGIHSELIMRRLKGEAEVHGTNWQNEVINAIIEERWKVGGTQRTVQEMMDAGELQGGERLSV